MMCALAIASAADAQSLQLTREAQLQMDSLAATSRALRVETAACVTSYAVQDGTTTIRALGPATYAGADSVTIFGWGGAPMCAPGEPTVHTHIHGVVVASGVDSVSKWRDDAPFALIVAITPSAWVLVRY